METNQIVMPGNVRPEGLLVRRATLRAPKRGEVILDVEATGMSFAEVQMRKSRYPGQPAFPFVPGYDVVGRVSVVGEGVPRDLVGARFAALTHVGGWTERLVLEAADLVPAPEGLDAGELLGLVVNGATAYKMLHRVAAVRFGQTIVVHGAGGGVGTTLLQLAALAGVKVIGTGTIEQAASIRALGATFVDYRKGNVLDAVRALARDGVDAVFDHVGGESLRASRRMLKRTGILVSYGSASTKDDRGSAWAPIVKNILRAMLWNLNPFGPRTATFDVWGRSSLTANHALRRDRYRQELRADLRAVFALLAEHRLRVPVAKRFPLEEASAAMRFHEAGGFTGKVILVPRTSP